MVVDFYNIVLYLQSVSFFQIVVPFLLIFVVIFTLLEKTRIFGPASIGVNVLVSLLLSALAIVNTTFIEFMNLYLGNFTIMVILFAVTLLLILFLSGPDFDSWIKWPTLILAVVAIVSLLAKSQYYSNADIFGNFGFFFYYMGPWIDNILVLGVCVVVLLVIISWAKKTRNSEPKNK